MSWILQHKYLPAILLIILIIGVYYQFFIFGKIPIPADTLIGAYYPYLDYNWGYKVGVPVKNPPISDVFSQFFLWKYLSAEILKSGNWPLWNPYSFSGTPFLATYHSATLLPFNMLLFLPKYMGWGLFIFGQTLFAALGMYFLLGKYIKGDYIKIAGSIVFAFSGLMTTWVEFGTGVWAAAALPWIFFALESFWLFKKIRSLFLLSVSFLCLFLSGHTQLTIFSSVIFFVFLLFKYLTDRKSVMMVGLLVLPWILSVGIAAIQFFPTFDFVNYSIRGDEKYSSTFNYGLNSIYEVVRLYAADFFGNPTTYNHFDTISYHEQSSFLGTLTLPLILPLLLKKFRTKLNIFWLGVFYFSLFLSLDNPLTKFFYSLPLPLLTYSSASRIFFLTGLSAAILLAFGLEKFLTNKSYRRFVQICSVALLIILGLVLCGVYIFAGQEKFQISFKNSILPAILLISLFILAVDNLKRWAIYIIVVLLLFDLGRYFLKYNPFVSQDLIFPQTPIHQFLKSQPGNFRIARADWEVQPPNTWVYYGLSSVEGYDPLASLNYAKLFNVINGENYDNGTSRYVLLKKYPSKYLDALNTKYFLAIKREREEASQSGLLNPQLRLTNYRVVFEDKNTLIFENPEVNDRAYFVTKVTTVKNKQELVEKISNKDFDPTKEAVIIGDIRTDTTVGNIQTSILINHIQIKTQTESSGFVVLANSFDKGWQIFRNDQQIKLYEVNGALQGFEVTEGENTFELKYWPKSFDLGLKITFVSLLLLILISIYSMIKRVW